MHIRKMALTGILSALVIILQLLSSMIKFGPFSITLTLIPIVVGAAIVGPLAGAWLGLVFGLTVLLSGDAAWFMEYNAFGTILTVLCKGIAAGFVPGVVYRALVKKSPTAAAIASSALSPIMNTGVFVLLCLVFFTELTGNLKAIIVGVVGVNFLVEFAVIACLTPVVVRVIDIWKNKKK